MKMTVGQLAARLAEMDQDATVVYALDISSYQPVVTVAAEKTTVGKGSGDECTLNLVVLV